MVQITIEVPANLVPRFYQFAGQFLAESEGSDEGSDDGSKDRRPWGSNPSDDHADATALWRKFSPNARAVFSLMIDNPGTRFTGDELAEAAGVPNGAHGVAGVLAWPGRHGWKIGRPLFVSYESDDDTGISRYWIPAEHAGTFASARAEAEGRS